MVIGNNLVTKRTEYPINGVTDDRRADMPDMHLLGGIGRGIVDNNALALAVLRNQAIPGGIHIGEPSCNPLARYGDIQKSRPGDFDL